MKKVVLIFASLVVLAKALDEDRLIPHLAFLMFNSQGSRNGFWSCGGALISETAVISDAACASQGGTGMAHYCAVWLGISHPWTHEMPEYWGKSLNITVHEEIAIVHLPEKVQLSENISIVNLPSDDSLGNGYVFGWEEQPWRTHTSSLKIDTCSQNKEQLCTSSSEDICVARGSSFLINNNQTLVGLSSDFNYQCNHPRDQVYIPIHKYVDWIKTQI